MSIEVRNISKSFGSFAALDNVSITFPAGELVGLLGPSGSGKTTLLRIIAGLEASDTGTVLFEGEDATQRNARERRVGFVFQHYALFRHMNVFDNIAFGLNVKPRSIRLPKDQIRKRVMDLLKLVQLDWLADRLPSHLSGGQRQRVALARALAVEPKVLLLDEPFGALDAKVRKELRRWLRRLHDEIHVTSIFVTHDVEEALEVSDQVVVMNQGKVEQIGTPDNVYEHPATPFVYDFLGSMIRLDDKSGSTSGVALARPHDMELQRERTDIKAIPAVVISIHTAGPLVRVELRRDDTHETIEAELSRERHRELNLCVGETVWVRPREVKVYTDDFRI